MTFNQLNIFCHIVEYGSVTRASKHLGIPQPAASRIVRSLEKEFGLPLFDSVGRGMVVNDNGRLLYDYAKQILQLNTKLESEMQSKKEETRYYYFHHCRSGILSIPSHLHRL